MYLVTEPGEVRRSDPGNGRVESRSVVGSREVIDAWNGRRSEEWGGVVDVSPFLCEKYKDTFVSSQSNISDPKSLEG